MQTLTQTLTQNLPTLDPEAAYALWAANYPAYAHNPLMQAEERAMLSLLPLNLEGCRVLDAGCGSGRYLAHARSRGAGVLAGIDLSEPMLRRAQAEVVCGEGILRTENGETGKHTRQPIGLARATLDAIPLRSGWTDIALCGLTIGHVEDLAASLAEMCRVTRPGGLLLCSDARPIGRTLGWPRDFKANGQRYAVRHAWREVRDWQETCGRVGLRLERVLEAFLDPADIPPDANFDRQGLQVPVALVLALRRPEAGGQPRRTSAGTGSPEN